MRPKYFFFDKTKTLPEIQYALPNTRLISQKQVHSTNVTVIHGEDELRHVVETRPEADALVTKLPNVGLVVHTADCLPLLAYSSDGVIGACHAGWRGLSNGVVEHWIGEMVRQGATLDSLKVFIGPAIGPCHFEVGLDVSDQLCMMDSVSLTTDELKLARHPHYNPEKSFIDLKALAQLRLKKAQVPLANVEVSPICTYCDTDYYSYRRDGPKAGRNEAVIYLTR